MNTDPNPEHTKSDLYPEHTESDLYVETDNEDVEEEEQSTIQSKSVLQLLHRNGSKAESKLAKKLKEEQELAKIASEKRAGPAKYGGTPSKPVKPEDWNTALTRKWNLVSGAPTAMNIFWKGHWTGLVPALKHWLFYNMPIKVPLLCNPNG